MRSRKLYTRTDNGTGKTNSIKKKKQLLTKQIHKKLTIEQYKLHKKWGSESPLVALV